MASSRSALRSNSVYPDQLVAQLRQGTNKSLNILLDEPINPIPPTGYIVNYCATDNVNIASVTTIDGQTLQTGDLVLLVHQTDASENGLYEYDTTLNRWGSLASGMTISVKSGNWYQDSIFILVTDDFEIDTDDLEFKRITDRFRYEDTTNSTSYTTIQRNGVNFQTLTGKSYAIYGYIKAVGTFTEHFELLNTVISNVSGTATLYPVNGVVFYITGTNNYDFQVDVSTNQLLLQGKGSGTINWTVELNIIEL